MIDALSPLSCCNRWPLDAELPESYSNENPRIRTKEQQKNNSQQNQEQWGRLIDQAPLSHFVILSSFFLKYNDGQVVLIVFLQFYQ